MANINKIKLSGTTYNIQDENATKTVELTQAQYDALAVKDPNTFYIITDATAGDLSNYYTKSETSGATEISTALGNKQDTLVSSTNIKTINNQSILGEGNIEIQGGGSSYTGVSGITINENNEIYYNGFVKTWLTSNHDDRYAVYWFKGGSAKIWINDNNPQGSMNYLRSQFSFGNNNLNSSIIGFALGQENNINGFCAGGLGEENTVNGNWSLGVNYKNKTNNSSEFASGQFNNSVSASTTFGDSGNTLFSVGNGTSDSARHNAFEIRQNGDIYITKDGADVKLQDQLGGGGSSYTAGDGIDITNDVISVTGKVDTSTYNTYTAATATEIGDKLAVSDFNTYSGTVDTVINSKASQSDLNTLSGTVTAHTANTDIHVTTAQTAAWNAKSDFSGNYNDLTNKPTIPTVPTSNTAFTNDAGYITSDAISGKVDTSTYETYTAATDAALASKANTATTYTKTEVDTALASKQDTLVSGTNIKTINNESILGSGNIDIQGGGSSKELSAGTNISITTGETADTINCTLPMFSGSAVGASKINHISNVASGLYSNAEGSFTRASRESAHAEGNGTTASGDYSHAEGYKTTASGNSAHAEGGECVASGERSHAEGYKTTASTYNSHTEGYYTVAYNASEHSNGKYNVSNTGSTTADKTLFSVGNGTADNARHNAFEIRQNGDIYLTKDGQDVKLQDQLGGGGGMTEDDELLLSTALTDLNDRKIDASEVKENYQRKGDYVTTSTLNTRLAEYETALDEQNVEEVTAYALNDLNTRFGGLKLTKITESEYAALTTKDENTLYIVVADPQTR